MGLPLGSWATVPAASDVFVVLITSSLLRCVIMAASGSRPSAPTLASLPDDLLVACFEQLEDPVERCAAPIASRQPPRGNTGSDPLAPPLDASGNRISSALLQAAPAAGGVLPLAASGRCTAASVQL